LAPTMGPHALEGVFIRTGNKIKNSNEQVVCGLVQRFGSLDFVTNNAGCFAGRSFPANGKVMKFGDHLVYVALQQVKEYPEKVLEAADPPCVLAAQIRGAEGQKQFAEVLVNGPAPPVQIGTPAPEAVGRELVTPDAPRRGKGRKERGPPLERHLGSTSANPFHVSMEILKKPLQADADPEKAKEELEKTRQQMLAQATELNKMRQDWERTNREYTRANSLAPSPFRRTATGELLIHGINLNPQFVPTDSEGSEVSIREPRPCYNTPAKNMRAAEVAAAECLALTGDELKKQIFRVIELTHEANSMNEQLVKVNPAPGASQIIHSGRNERARSHGQASSPAHHGDRERSVNSGKNHAEGVPGENRTIRRYDPVVAGKQNVQPELKGRGQGNAGRGKDQGGQGCQDQRHEQQGEQGYAARGNNGGGQGNAGRGKEQVGQGNAGQGSKNVLG
jgi:hypothetical protein